MNKHENAEQNSLKLQAIMADVEGDEQNAEIAQLRLANAELLEALELVMRCDEKGFINLKAPWHNRIRRAIRKAKDRS